MTNSPRGAMVAVAGIATTVAALPRAAAWCADDSLWHHADDPAPVAALVAELLRVTAATNGDRPRSFTRYPPTLACPNAAPCLAGPYTPAATSP